jgi:soluble lytic murein transglycosylase
MSIRLYRVYRAAGLALAAAALVACSTASAVKPVPLSQLTNDDQIFVQLREAARTNDAARAAQLASMLPNYPAP